MGLFISTLALLASSEVYTSHPALGDKEPHLYDDKRVEAVIDKGIVRELIIACKRDLSGVMVHDVVADLYCDSKNVCHEKLSSAIANTCSQ